MTDRNAILAAADRIAADPRAAFLRRTPLWKLPGAALGSAAGEVWLKLEHLQAGGSFKARGMYNRLLANPIPASGVIVASGGNAGIATAAAARALGAVAVRRMDGIQETVKFPLPKGLKLDR